MKNLSKEFIAALMAISLLLVLNCCERNDNTTEILNNEDLFEPTVYNEDLSNLSQSLSSLIRESPETRKIIKGEALKMFDGDYDIMFEDFVSHTISDYETDVKGSVKSSIKNLIDEMLNSKIKGSKSETSIVEKLTEKYPYLQVSVPVNAEDWNDDDYVPVVTFVPEEYDEANTEYVTGYSPEGDPILVDAVNPPSDPVIVLSMNERIEIIDDIKGPAIPPRPTNLIGSATETGIRLHWYMPDTTNQTNTTGYYVFRKGPNDTYYNLHITIPGAFNRTFDDINIVPASSYSYYVIAYYQAETSSASNYISVIAPNLPKPVASFVAIQHALQEVELRWVNDMTQSIDETRLYKHVVDVTSGYELVRSFPRTEYDYFDGDIVPGKKNIYKITHVTSLGESSPKYDFIHTPFRDPSKESPVYIKQLKFTCPISDIEGWLKGKPEFYIKVTNVDQGNKNPFIVQEEIICKFDSRSKTSQIFSGRKVLGWKPGFWYDMLTFTAIEYDRPSSELKFSIGVGFNTKDTIKLGLLEAKAGVEYEVKFSNKGKKCGTTYLDYYTNPEWSLEFPNYGFQILVSDIDY